MRARARLCVDRHAGTRPLRYGRGVNLISVQDASDQHGLALRTMFKLIKTQGLTRYKKAGDRRTFLDVAELDEALRPHPKDARVAVPPDQTSLTPGEERMTTEDGRNVIVAAVIPHPDGLPEVLLSVRVHGQEHVYSWLGGHVHKGETPADAVIRELREELVIDSPRVIRTLERIDTHIDASPWWGHRFSQGYVSFNLLVDVGSADIQVIDHEELKGVRWVPLSDLVEEWTRKLPPELRNPAIRSATEAVNHRATELRAGT